VLLATDRSLEDALGVLQVKKNTAIIIRQNAGKLFFCNRLFNN